MNAYVIGIGGTGAKCAEAVIHACAAGIVSTHRLTVLFVDPDSSNGTLETAVNSVRRYCDARPRNWEGENLFATTVGLADPPIWSPLMPVKQGDPLQPNLDLLLEYPTLPDNAQGLFDVLFTKQERETRLHEGFRGHPSIGAAVMASTALQTEPWPELFEGIKNDLAAGEVRIVLAGSIFGGTGAAGLATLARLIRQELANTLGTARLKLAGVLMLPYFSFNFGAGDSQEMRANSDDFILNSQAALQYYARHNLLAPNAAYDALYVLGEENLTPLPNASIGGRTQRNAPHFIELYAALAVVDALGSDASGCRMIARNNARDLAWADLPATVRSPFEQLARFCFAYLSTYEVALAVALENPKWAYRAPWFVDLVLRYRDQPGEMEGRSSVKAYAEDFLGWLANIQGSIQATLSPQAGLAFQEAFAESGLDGSMRVREAQRFERSAFGNLLRPRKGEDRGAMARLWEQMCDAKPEMGPAAGALPRVVSTLYRECGRGLAR